MAVGRARACVDAWRWHTAATAAAPQGRSRTQLCGALMRRAPRCRRTGKLTLTLTRARTLTLTLTQDGQEPPEKKLWMFPAVAVLLQCILLFVGGLIFRIVRRKEDHAI